MTWADFNIHSMWQFLLQSFNLDQTTLLMLNVHLAMAVVQFKRDINSHGNMELSSTDIQKCPLDSLNGHKIAT